MRVSKIFAGSALVLALALAGCSANTAPTEPDTQETSAPATDPTTDPTTEVTDEPKLNGDCPAIAIGDTIDAISLSTCTAEAMKVTAGYAAVSETLGLTNTVKANPIEGEYESLSDMGSFIIKDSTVWVKSTGDWALSDENSDDMMVAALSKAANALAAGGLTDTSALTGAQFTADLSVMGTDTLLGRDVFILEGQMEVDGQFVDMKVSMTPDYVVLATETSGDISGTKFTATMTVTEWDKKQDIQAPM